MEKYPEACHRNSFVIRPATRPDPPVATGMMAVAAYAFELEEYTDFDKDLDLLREADWDAEEDE